MCGAMWTGTVTRWGCWVGLLHGLAIGTPSSGWEKPMGKWIDFDGWIWMMTGGKFSLRSQNGWPLKASHLQIIPTQLHRRNWISAAENRWLFFGPQIGETHLTLSRQVGIYPLVHHRKPWLPVKSTCFFFKEKHDLSNRSFGQARSGHIFSQSL